MGTSTDCTAAMMCRTRPRSASQAGACSMAPCTQNESRDESMNELQQCCSVQAAARHTELQSSRDQVAGLSRCICSRLQVAGLSNGGRFEQELAIVSPPAPMPVSLSDKGFGSTQRLSNCRALRSLACVAAEPQKVCLCSERLWCPGSMQIGCAEAEQLLGFAYSLPCKANSLKIAALACL